MLHCLITQINHGLMILVDGDLQNSRIGDQCDVFLWKSC